MIVDTGEELLRQYAAEQLANQHLEIKVGLSPELASILIANLQLALRHPANTGTTAEMASAFVASLIARFRELGLPLSAQVAEMGNNPAFDRPC